MLRRSAWRGVFRAHGAGTAPQRGSDPLGQGLERRARPRQIRPNCPGDTVQDQSGVGDRRQRDEYDARTEVITQLPAHRQRQAGLTYPARPGQRHEPGTGTSDQVGYLADRLNRLGVEDALLKAGAKPGDGVAIGSDDDAVVFDWEPTMAAGAG